jgi:hypothetical protein
MCQVKMLLIIFFEKQVCPLGPCHNVTLVGSTSKLQIINVGKTGGTIGDDIYSGCTCADVTAHAIIHRCEVTEGSQSVHDLHIHEP